MRKIIAAINMTVDGICDHTVMMADDELHEHYNELLRNTGVMVYGRNTYQLMEDYWPALVEAPSGNKSMDDFAVLIDLVPKLVFSHSLTKLKWATATLATRSLTEELTELKKQEGKDIFVGSPGLIVSCSNLGLIDAYQLAVHPVIAGKGQRLFKDIAELATLQLISTKKFGSGAIVLYYDVKKA